jgi:hypothetical protein
MKLLLLLWRATRNEEYRRMSSLMRTIMRRIRRPGGTAHCDLEQQKSGRDHSTMQHGLAISVAAYKRATGKQKRGIHKHGSERRRSEMPQENGTTKYRPFCCPPEIAFRLH